MREDCSVVDKPIVMNEMPFYLKICFLFRFDFFLVFGNNYVKTNKNSTYFTFKK